MPSPRVKVQAERINGLAVAIVVSIETMLAFHAFALRASRAADQCIGLRIHLTVFTFGEFVANVAAGTDALFWAIGLAVLHAWDAFAVIEHVTERALLAFPIFESDVAVSYRLYALEWKYNVAESCQAKQSEDDQSH